MYFVFVPIMFLLIQLKCYVNLISSVHLHEEFQILKMFLIPTAFIIALYLLIFIFLINH